MRRSSQAEKHGTLCASPRPMLRRALPRFAAAAAIALLAGGACLSPTLPLPPPELPDTIKPSASYAGTWEIAGACARGALITLFNERARKGVVAEDTDRNGRYLAQIEAERCDTIVVWQEVLSDGSGVEESASQTFVIEEHPSGAGADGACP